MEKMQGVRLDELSIVHQPAQLLRRGRQGSVTGDNIHRLRRGQMMAHRTNTAKALDDNGNLPVWPPFDKPFKSAHFDDMQPHLMDLVLFVQQDRDLAVPFDARNRIDGDAARFLRRRGCFQFGMSFSSVVAEQLEAQSRIIAEMRSVTYFQIVSPDGGQPGMK